MFRDSLQKRLQEMERESPSPSLETAKPTLRERVGFLGRYFSRAVEQVPQRNSIYGSLDDQLNDYKSAVEFAELPERAEYWLGVALDDARNGEKNISGYKAALSLAESEGKINIPKELRALVEDLYLIAIPTEGPRHVQRWLGVALDDARNGEKNISGYKAALNIAYDFAREAGIEISPEEIDIINSVYENNKSNSVPRHVQRWLKIAGDEIAQGKFGDSEVSLRIARDYASEIGQKI